MVTGEQHSFLIILRVNTADAKNLLRCGAIDEGGQLQYIARGKASLVVGIVDATNRAATTPMVGIHLEKNEVDQFNKILSLVNELNTQYRREGGYIADPMSFGRTEQGNVQAKIRDIGTRIYALLAGDRSVVKEWLDDLFKQNEEGGRSKAQERVHHVTIVTNDFSIPWYWLNSMVRQRFLCETVSLGMLQLASLSPLSRDDEYDDDDEERWGLVPSQYSALLVNGSPGLPFTEAELGAVASGLTSSEAKDTNARTEVTVQAVASIDDLLKVVRGTEKWERENGFRIIHFTGHYMEDDFVLNGQSLKKRGLLDMFVRRSLFVLDACSRSEGMKAWTELDAVTARLLRRRAAGCLVPVLPVKNDPIVADVFWNAFYREIRTEGVSVGRALLRARQVLRAQLEQNGLTNPSWLLYQLVGNPAVEVFADAREGIRAE